MIERVGKELGVKEVCLLALPSSEFDSDSIEKLSDWYSIPKRRVMDRGGFGPFIYHKSMADVLTSLYPEYPWEVDKFVINIRHPEGYWDREMQQFIINAEKHLGIQQVRTANENPTYLPPSPQFNKQKPSDWYSVTLADLKQIGATSSFRKVKLAEALQERYPGFEWEKVYLLKGRFGQQKRLEHLVAELFPVCFPSSLFCYSNYDWTKGSGDCGQCKKGSKIDQS